MILGFKPQFKKPIIDGTKIHTIREDKVNRWKAGNIIHFSTGTRTTQYECFKKGKCVSVQTIEIRHKYTTEEHFYVEGSVCIDGRYLSNIDIMMELAPNDGFSCIANFWEYFNTDFKGKIIHWTDFKY